MHALPTGIHQQICRCSTLSDRKCQHKHRDNTQKEARLTHVGRVQAEGIGKCADQFLRGWDAPGGGSLVARRRRGRCHSWLQTAGSSSQSGIQHSKTCRHNRKLAQRTLPGKFFLVDCRGCNITRSGSKMHMCCARRSQHRGPSAHRQVDLWHCWSLSWSHALRVAWARVSRPIPLVAVRRRLNGDAA